MAAETVASSTGAGGKLTAMSTGLKGLVVAHPLAFGAAGVVIVGAGAYYLVKHFRKGDEEVAPAQEEAAAAA